MAKGACALEARPVLQSFSCSEGAGGAPIAQVGLSSSFSIPSFGYEDSFSQRPLGVGSGRWVWNLAQDFAHDRHSGNMRSVSMLLHSGSALRGCCRRITRLPHSVAFPQAGAGGAGSRHSGVGGDSTGSRHIRGEKDFEEGKRVGSAVSCLTGMLRGPSFAKMTLGLRP